MAICVRVPRELLWRCLEMKDVPIALVQVTKVVQVGAQTRISTLS